MTDPIPAFVAGRLQPVDKLAAHCQGLRHKAVSVFVMRAGLLLIQRRAAAKYHTPGLWANTCCTHPHLGEDPADCAVRRLREELGIEGLTPGHRGQVEYRADVGGGMTEHEVVDLYHAEAPAGLTPRPNPAEVSGTRWVSPAALAAEVRAEPHRFTPWLAIYLDRHAALIFGEPVR